MHKLLVLCSVLLVLTGCAPFYDAQNASKTAQFYIASKSDSDPKKTNLRNTYASAFADEGCEINKRGLRLGGKIGNSENAESEPIRIEAEQKFTFTGTYGEARFGETRDCHVTGSFIPLTNHIYKALVIATNDVSGCQLGLYDVTSGKNEEVAFSMPAHSCSILHPDKNRPNGTPIRTRYQYQVITR